MARTKQTRRGKKRKNDKKQEGSEAVWSTVDDGDKNIGAEEQLDEPPPAKKKLVLKENDKTATQADGDKSKTLVGKVDKNGASKDCTEETNEDESKSEESKISDSTEDSKELLDKDPTEDSKELLDEHSTSDNNVVLKTDSTSSTTEVKDGI